MPKTQAVVLYPSPSAGLLPDSPSPLESPLIATIIIHHQPIVVNKPQQPADQL